MPICRVSPNIMQVVNLMHALGDPTRRRLLESFHRTHAAGMTVDDASRLLHLDRTVAFDHLEILRSLGVLVADEQRSGRRGRPARLYRLSRTEAVELSVPQRRNGSLSAVFARALTEIGPHGVELARQHGRRLGLELVSGTRSASKRSAILREFGGDYRISENEVHARNCVFREGCGTEPPVACHAHAGMLEAVMTTGDTAVEIVPAGADGRGGCRYLIKR